MTQHLPPPLGVPSPGDRSIGVPLAPPAEGAVAVPARPDPSPTSAVFEGPEVLADGRIRFPGTARVDLLVDLPGLGATMEPLLRGARARTFAGLLAADPADGPLIAALLTCDPLVACLGSRGSFEQPLPAVLGRPLPPGVELAAAILDVRGALTYDARRPWGPGRPPVVAVCRTLPDGRVRSAVAGVGNVPVLVAPGDEPPEIGGEFAAARRASVSVTLGRARGEARFVPPPPLAPFPAAPGDQLVVLHAEDVPCFAGVGVPGVESSAEVSDHDPIVFERHDDRDPEEEARPDGDPRGEDDDRSSGEFEGQQTVVHLDGSGASAGIGESDEEPALCRRRSSVEIELDVSDGDPPPIVAAWCDLDGRLNVRLTTDRPFAARAELARRLPASAARVRVISAPGDVAPQDGELSPAVLAVARRVWGGSRPMEAVEPRRRRRRTSRARIEVDSATTPDGVLVGLATSVVSSPPPLSKSGREVAGIGRALAIADHLARVIPEDAERDGAGDGDPATVARPGLLAALWAAGGGSGTPRPSLVTAWSEAHRRGDACRLSGAVPAGHGVAGAWRAGGAADGIVGASVTVTEDGSLLAAASCADPRGCAAPALQRIVAEVLGTSVAGVQMILGDTDRVAGHEGHVGLGGFATAARAVLRAAEALRRAIAERAAEVLDTGDWRMIEVAGRQAIAPGRRQIGIGELAGGGSLLAGYGQASAGEATEASALVAGVTIVVDPHTGEADATRAVLVVDAGVVVDPDGAGAILRAEAQRALDRLLGVPRAPTEIEIVVVESLDDDAPLGARSLPPVTGPLAAAIGDALHLAIGYRPQHYPLRADELLAAASGPIGIR